MNVRYLFLMCALAWVFTGQATAQPTCFANYPANACDYPYSDGDNMFAGRVVSLTGGEQQAEINDLNGYVHGRATVAIELIFSGDVAGTVELTLRSGCWGRIEKNKKYIFHASRMADGLYVSRWSSALDDLPPGDFNDVVEGIRALGNGARQPRLYGTLRRYGPRGFSGFYESRGVPGVVVVAEKGEERFEARTDASGHYEFAGLPEGDYSVFPRLPPSLKPPDEDGQPREKYNNWARVNGHGLCGARVDFVAWDNGVIRGRVEDADGRPVDYTNINLWYYDKDVKSLPIYPAERVMAEKREGKFAFVNLPPAQYLLEVSVRSGSGEILEFFYPGVVLRKSARVIDLAAANPLAEVVVQLPRLTKRRIFGQVRMPDGRPVNATVVLVDDVEHGPRSWVEAKGGLFELRFFQGRPFSLFAYEDGVKGGKAVRFFTRTRVMTAERDVGPLVITLDRAVPKAASH